MYYSYIKELLNEAKQKLIIANNAFSEPMVDAEILLSKILKKDRSYLYTWPEYILDTKLVEKFNHYIMRRVSGEPIAYITGTKGFWDSDFYVTKDVFIPRSETELIVQYVLCNFLEQNIRLLDLGTGSGAIALSIGKYRPTWQVIAVDCCNKALTIAKNNAKKLKIDNINFILSSWTSNIESQEKFNVIVSNPPYIAEKDSYLLKGDSCYEPHIALVGGPDGLSDIKRIIKNVRKILINGGSLIIEHGFNQYKEINNILVDCNYGKINTMCDLSGHIRLTTAIFL